MLSQPVEQFRMSCWFSLSAEVVRCGHDRLCEMTLPDSIRHDSRRQWITAIHDPVRQLQSTTCAIIFRQRGTVQDLQKSSWNHVAGFGGIAFHLHGNIVKPIRSNVARRIRVRFSASGAGCNPEDSSFDRTKFSIGLNGHDVSFTSGSRFFTIGRNDQTSRAFYQSISDLARMAATVFSSRGSGACMRIHADKSAI